MKILDKYIIKELLGPFLFGIAAFTFILAGIYDKTFAEVNEFFTSQPTKILISLLFVVSYFFSALTISEIFEDYMENQKIKNVANKILYLFAILIPLLTLIIIYNLNL